MRNRLSHVGSFTETACVFCTKPLLQLSCMYVQMPFFKIVTSRFCWKSFAPHNVLVAARRNFFFFTFTVYRFAQFHFNVCFVCSQFLVLSTYNVSPSKTFSWSHLCKWTKGKSEHYLLVANTQYKCDLIKGNVILWHVCLCLKAISQDGCDY